MALAKRYRGWGTWSQAVYVLVYRSWQAGDSESSSFGDQMNKKLRRSDFVLSSTGSCNGICIASLSRLQMMRSTQTVPEIADRETGTGTSFFRKWDDIDAAIQICAWRTSRFDDRAIFSSRTRFRSYHRRWDAIGRLFNFIGRGEISRASAPKRRANARQDSIMEHLLLYDNLVCEATDDADEKPRWNKMLRWNLRQLSSAESGTSKHWFRR